MRIIKRIVQGLAIVIAVILVYLTFVALGPGFEIQAPQLKEDGPSIRAAPAFRQDASFDVLGDRLGAFLYLPADTSRPVPAIVMAHGFGGTKDFMLEAYALRFRDEGFAVLTFDYRFTGASEGEPRQLIWLPFQLQDLEAAIRHVRSVDEVDPGRVSLWGTSLGGGHVMMAAARDDKIRAVVAQVPFLDPAIEPEEHSESGGQIIQLLIHAQRDMIRSRFNMEPHRIPLFGEPGSIAMMTTPDAYAAYQSLVPRGYVNRVCARVILRAAFYRPVDTAQMIQAQVLIQLAERDTVVPPTSADETISKLGDLATVKRYDAAHFEIYTGGHFEQSVADQVAFLTEHLRP